MSTLLHESQYYYATLEIIVRDIFKMISSLYHLKTLFDCFKKLSKG